MLAQLQAACIMQLFQTKFASSVQHDYY